MMIGLFRAALWAGGKERVDKVSQSLAAIADLLNSGVDDNAGVLRRLYEMYPDTRFRKQSGTFLAIMDPLFPSRLCEYAREKMEAKSFERAVKDTVKPVEVLYIEQEIKDKEQLIKNNEAVSVNETQRYFLVFLFCLLCVSCVCVCVFVLPCLTLFFFFRFSQMRNCK